MPSDSPQAKLNHVVFWPPFLLLVAAIVANFVAPDQYMATIKFINSWILKYFGWLFVTCAAASLIVCIVICCCSWSGLGKVRLGGNDAKPLMSMWNWFSITICTTIAIGILFWSTAEPISHLMNPPAWAGVEPETKAAATFSLATMYLHWSFTPYAIYCVASLMFAFAYYNMKQPFSLGATLSPLLGNSTNMRSNVTIGNLIDAVCLYALVAGMAAALGTGILMLGGGLEDLFGIKTGPLIWGGIALAIVTTFIISSATGLMKGIRILSDINTKLLFALALVPLFFGPGLLLLTDGGVALMDYAIHFVPRNLDFQLGDWGNSWTVFYWAVWLAWAPITACFLGRIAYGRTVREFMLVNFLFPSIFAIVWMTIFSGTAMHLQLEGHPLEQFVADGKPESVSFAVFKTFPLATPIVIFYMISAFVCFVTSSDSNVSAMAGISSSGISPDNPEGNQWLKIAWGVTVGSVAWIMISFAGGTDGVRILSNLGGFPAAILQLFIIASLVIVIFRYKTLDQVTAEKSE
jgi:choline-glycine betaine transporter